MNELERFVAAVICGNLLILAMAATCTAIEFGKKWLTKHGDRTLRHWRFRRHMRQRFQ